MDIPPNKPIDLPQRPWDFYTELYGGAYFWFDEMTYMNGSSMLCKLRVEETSGALLRDVGFVGSFVGSSGVRTIKCGECDACLDRKMCSFNFFHSSVQEAYKKWLSDAFEQAFELGASNDD